MLFPMTSQTQTREADFETLLDMMKEGAIFDGKDVCRVARCSEPGCRCRIVTERERVPEDMRAAVESLEDMNAEEADCEAAPGYEDICACCAEELEAQHRAHINEHMNWERI